MLDFLRLAIPIIPTYVRSLDNHHWFNGDIRDYGIPAATRHVSKTDDGQTITGSFIIRMSHFHLTIQIWLLNFIQIQ